MFILHDKRIPESYTNELKKHLPVSVFLGFGPEDTKVYSSISCHPDIYFFQLDAGTIVHAPGIDRSFLEKLRACGVNLVSGEKDPLGEYPSTALYNAARVGDKIFLNKKHADKKVLEAAEKEGLAIIDVPQGYTRCSVLAVSGNAFITSDRKIAVSGRDNGFEVLEVNSDCVELLGENHGFIGGGGGMNPYGELVILGDTKFHPDGQKINDFINIHSRGFIFTENLPLLDAGSLFFL